MEKEKKKLLLVAVSVGVFLVIIISAAILVLTPKVPAVSASFSSTRPIPSGPGGTETGRTQPAYIDPSQMLNDESIRGIQTPSGTTASQETNLNNNVESNNGDGRVTINIPKPSSAAVPDIPAASETASGVGKPAAVTTQAKPAVTATQVKPSAATAKPAAAKQAPAPAKTRNDYWVQTGAFTAKVRAEGVKETLASKGITSIIENSEINGRTWYRVRVGPYTSENEANYWLALVKSIDGFADSQVRQTTTALR
jgi:DedD protein